MNDEIFESMDRWMGEEAKLRRFGEARRKAASEKIAKERGWAPSDPHLLFVLLDRRPGEGKIVRTPEGCTTTVFYTPEMIAQVAKERPWLLAELMKELNGGDQ